MKKIILMVSIITLLGCQIQKKETVSDEKKDEIKEKVKLYALDGGSIFVKKLEAFSQDTTYTGRTKQFADAYYVISHPKGNLMWDAGLPESLVIDEPFDEPSGVFAIKRSDSLKNQLESIGFKIEDFDFFAMSHSHFDHTGHANYMKNATWLVQENEYNSVLGDSLEKKDPAVLELKKVKKLNGDYDVFGDSTVIIKYMPGHTIGHQVLYLDLGLKQPVLLTGDLYHFEENRKHKRIPSFNHNVEDTKKSMEKFEAFAKEKNANVFIQHSPKDFERIKKLVKQN